MITLGMVFCPSDKAMYGVLSRMTKLCMVFVQVTKLCMVFCPCDKALRGVLSRMTKLRMMFFPG